MSIRPIVDVYDIRVLVSLADTQRIVDIYERKAAETSEQ